MNITVVGIGYVGAVSAVCFAKRGHRVCGIDINRQKVDSINNGQPPIVEPGLEALLSECIRAGNLRATCDLEEALRESDICFVSVATPSLRNGQIDASQLLRACEQIAVALRALKRRQIVVIRSSVMPNVFEQASELFESQTGGLVELSVNPEFLREGTAIADFENPPFTVIGTENARVEKALRELYSYLNAPIFILRAKEATLLKYASNAFHALKVAFANEIGAVCQHAGIDGEAVMEVFCRDNKLNISPYYLRPGFAFGGSCLPKDVRALLYAAKSYDIELPLIEGLMESNVRVIDRAVEVVLDAHVRHVGLIGLSFKKSTDDLRESPFVELAERLIGKGIELRIYDPNVSLARLTGANKNYINQAIPHLSRVLVGSIAEAIQPAELVVIGHNFDGVDSVRADCSRYHLLDLTGQLKFKSMREGSVGGS